MKYPIDCKNIIDVTKPPYCADNSGKEDCTEVLRRILTDVLIREAEGIESTKEKLQKSEGEMYIGFETRITPDYINVIYPEFVPASRIIYFPAGTYRVSDTVTYIIENFKNIWGSKPHSELCRGIHILGESRESVTIRLADNSKGFEKGEKKPVISFNNAPRCCEESTTNIAQMNTIEDLTIDCGVGNPGAIGLRYMANNSGRVQNVDIKATEGCCGLQCGVGSEGSFINIKVEGFDYGVAMQMSSICVFENVDLSRNIKAGFLTRNAKVVLNDVKTSPISMFEFLPSDKGVNGLYYCVSADVVSTEDTKGNYVYVEENKEFVKRPQMPCNMRSDNPNDYVCVDDFGAVGDGKTDCTEAIQKALNSGKSIVVFGEGHYLVNGEINIPETVKTIDFMFCDLFAGDDIINNKEIGVFNINEESEDMLFIENLYTYDQFYGHFRLIKHSAKRDLCMSDLHTQAAAMYFNTVSGSKVYMDNCACTTGTYSQNLILGRPGKKPEYSAVIPFEFHGQSVYGRQVNPERADVEMLNDNSDIILDGYKVEGPGTALCTINGGCSKINVFTAGIGNMDAENALFETKESDIYFNGGVMSGFREAIMYNILFKDDISGIVNVLTSKDVTDKPSDFSVRVKKYQRYR